jgi:hypothetical protein
MHIPLVARLHGLILALGALLAPTPANRSLIDRNIVSSVRAFGDRNRDGREDDGRGRSRRRSGSDD